MHAQETDYLFVIELIFIILKIFILRRYIWYVSFFIQLHIYNLFIVLIKCYFK